MGANQNSLRNLAYIPKSTQIHNTRNLTAKSRAHASRDEELGTRLSGRAVSDGRRKEKLSKPEKRGAAVTM
jgi:hypothetical protein